MNVALETHDLTRDFGTFRAVDQLSLRVPAGCFYGFLGPNGAGKSITIKMLTGLLAPTGGTVRILGEEVGNPWRAPEVKIAWGRGFVVTLIIGASVLSTDASRMPDALKPFILLLAMVGSPFMLVQLLGNQFGYDRQGFRAFALSPMDRRWILLGKKLATWPVGGTLGLLLLGFMTYWLRLSPLVIAAALRHLLHRPPRRLDKIRRGEGLNVANAMEEIRTEQGLSRLFEQHARIPAMRNVR